jgi:hypothetical protein
MPITVTAKPMKFIVLASLWSFDVSQLFYVFEDFSENTKPILIVLVLLESWIP